MKQIKSKQKKLGMPSKSLLDRAEHKTISYKRINTWIKELNYSIKGGERMGIGVFNNF